ncbi:MAG TPA: RIP metalloprotease RseP [Pyrinomonadaceae bacterium]|nr:RIP metalloprotease RseP [Pyrinomonadaceae bacterium]
MGYLINGTLAFIFILGAAVVIHEFGHFIVAKLLGIRVETFSVGFGKRIWGRRWGTTDYRLSLVPLGGYVKLGGDESNASIEGESASDIPTRERFDLRPRWQKFLVGIAGPVMNVLTALAIPFIGAMAIGVPASPTPVVNVIEDGSAAQVAGLKKGDRIVSFNGTDSPTWRQIEGDAMLAPEQSLPLTVEREGQRIPTNIKPVKRTRNGEAYGVLGMQPDFGALPGLLDEVREGSPAAAAGLKGGDRIVAIGGEDVRDNEHIAQYIQEHPGAIRITVERDGARQELQTGEARLPDGKLGIGFQEVPTERVGPLAALAYAYNLNVEIMRLTGKALGQVFSGKRSARDTFSGPIGIARASSQAANEGGWGGIFGMLAFLSLNLGIFNLLPIPVLDGGMIFMLFVEGALAWIGVKLSMTMRERIQQVGFVFLLLLMGFVIINDITKTAAGWRSSSNNPPAATSSPTK